VVVIVIGIFELGMKCWVGLVVVVVGVRGGGGLCGGGREESPGAGSWEQVVVSTSLNRFLAYDRQRKVEICKL
jgi:hypothetical protein